MDAEVGRPIPAAGNLEAKRLEAEALLRASGRVLVALSGGVDSAALLAVARGALGDGGVLAVTGRSDAVTDDEVADAAAVAAALGVEHLVITTNEIERAGYRENKGRRCFHCRTELFEQLARIASERGCDAIAYGAVVDDLGDDRPGMEAATRFGVLAPLLDAGINKDEARAIARQAGLPVHDKPASPCLASRVPIGIEVTPERLDRVRRAEAGLRNLGFRVFRVRHHGEIARLELDAGEERRLDDPSVRAAAVAAIKGAGYRWVALDLEGYRPGGGLYRIGPKRASGQ